MVTQNILISLFDFRISFAISKGDTLGIPSIESVRCIPLHTELIVSILSNRMFLTSFPSSEIFGGFILYLIVRVDF